MNERLFAAAQAALKILDDAETVGLLDDESRAGVEEFRAALAASDVPDGRGLFLTVVYRNVQPGVEATELTRHPKMVAVSWSHAIRDRDAARMMFTQPEYAQPVAWRWLYDGEPDGEQCFPMPGPDQDLIDRASKRDYPRSVQYLWGGPFEREWSGLTEEEVNRLKRLGFVGVESVEAMLKERNA